ncbi:unnamed protein product [Callosobruchus maculatus]|nr:unnamed protein product [Callosobruchus maculatus]
MLLFNAIKIYWRTIFVIIYPLSLLPIFLMNNTTAMRCMFVVLLMSGYWVSEALPLAVTSLIPMVLFPLMGVLDSDKVSLCYLKETNMMFVGGLIIAIAIEHCNLHTRLSLYTIRLIGCSPRKLHLALCSITMFVSMWISNTAATAMMIPIIDATLKALEEQGIGQMWEPEDENATARTQDGGLAMGGVEGKRPTKTTMCMFISTAYAAGIGGCGCVIGSGTNMAFQGLFETIFPESGDFTFTKWMLFNVPVMLVVMYVSVLFLQVWFMGLFRPNSKDAAANNVGKEGEAVARKMINQQLEEMGPMSFHEICVGILFVSAILLWFFRSPQFIPGWAEFITKSKIKDSTPALVICMFLFTLPANYDFIYMFSSDENKRPKQSAPSLVTWKLVQQRMPWGLIFLLGGGFAMAEASKKSGMSTLIAEHLRGFADLDIVYVMMISGMMGAFLTQFASNVAVATVILPVLAEVSIVAEKHPMSLMMPAALCCSYAYCLPVSTPPNAIAAAPCNMPTFEMVKVGIFMTLISCSILFAIFPFYAPLIWDLHSFPEWAVTKNATTPSK